MPLIALIAPFAQVARSIADTCHGMFGFEKPRWHYIPGFGALMDALAKAAQTLPEARARFLSGDLPPSGQLMVRYNAADADELLWARVESWVDGSGVAAWSVAVLSSDLEPANRLEPVASRLQEDALRVVHGPRG